MKRNLNLILFLTLLGLISFVTNSCTYERSSNAAARQESNSRLNSLIRQEIDTLDSKFLNIADEALFDSLCAEGRRFVNLDNNRALQYFTLAERVGLHCGDSLKIVEAGRMKGQMYRRIHRLTESVNSLKRVLPIAERNNFEIELSNILNAVAITYTFLSSFDLALKYHYRSLELKKKVGDQSELAIAYNNLGLLHYKLRDYEKALSCYLQSLQIKNEIADDFDLKTLLTNISLTYVSLNKYEKAHDVLKQVESICANGCSDQILLQVAHAKGTLLLAQKHFESAKREFSKSLKISEKVDEKRYMSDNFLCLGEIEFLRNRYSLAEKYLRNGLAVCLSSEYYSTALGYYRQLSELYIATSNFKNATMFQHKYLLLKDSIMGQEINNKIAAIQLDAKEKNDQAVIKHKEELIEYQATQRKLAIIVAVLLFLVLCFLLTVIQKNRKLQSLLISKFQDRTHELENTDRYYRTLASTQTGVYHKALSDLKSPIATIRGVSSIALDEIRDSHAQVYFHRINRALRDIEEIVMRSEKQAFKQQ
jgi:tetratricopeptide (TPR) repeat protein